MDKKCWTRCNTLALVGFEPMTFRPWRVCVLTISATMLPFVFSKIQLEQLPSNFNLQEQMLSIWSTVTVPSVPPYINGFDFFFRHVSIELEEGIETSLWLPWLLMSSNLMQSLISYVIVCDVPSWLRLSWKTLPSSFTSAKNKLMMKKKKVFTGGVV